MRIEIEIPKEFEEHFNQDKFKDSFERIMTDINYSFKNADYLCSKYEYETIEMLQKAFENSRQAYPVDKVVEKLEEESNNDLFSTDRQIGFKDAIEIVKQGGVTNSDDVCEWKDKKLYGYYTSCTEFRSRIAYKDAYWKHCPYCGKKIKVVE